MIRGFLNSNPDFGKYLLSASISWDQNKSLLPTIIHKIFEAKIYFSCEIVYYGKSSISVFQEIFTSTGKFSFWEGGWALANNFMKFWDFPDIF